MCDQEHDLDYDPDRFQERIDRACELGFNGTSAELTDWETAQEAETNPGRLATEC